jgi:hypothetical protein
VQGHYLLTTFGYNVASSLELQASTKSTKETALNQEKAAAAFETLVAAIQNGARKPLSVTQVVMFNLCKAISSAYPDKFSADHRYYQGKNGYYDDSKASFWKQMIARRAVKDFEKEVNATG